MNIRNICALSLVLAVGCNEVEDRLSWSPDGSRAILRVEGNLHFMDTNGNLSAVVASNVTAATWLPDSRGLVLLRSLTVTEWKDAESLLPTAEIDAAKTLAKGFLAFGVEGMEQFELKRPELASAAILYLFDEQSNALHEAAQRSKDPGKLEADLSNMRTTQVAEVSVIALDGKQLRVIERTLTELGQPLPSPTAPVIAFVRGEALTVAPLDGSTNRAVAADKTMGIYDWTPDGKTLVYAVRQSDKDNGNFQLAEIQRRIVLDTNGVLVAGDTRPLTMNASTFAPRVKCLEEGRVLFAGNPLQLPSPATTAPLANFYLIDPALGTNAVPVAIPAAAGMLPQDLGAFVLSPDGRRIAVVESGSDSVAVLDVATGNLEIVSPKRGWKSRILPAWRGTNELYFAALPASSTNRPELFRWRKGSAPQVVSSNWTDAAVGSLLEKPSK
jgi:hypothetical protein